MSRLLVRLLTLALALGALVVAPSVAVAGDPCFHSFDTRPATSSGSTSQVVLGDCVFTPTVTRVALGTTVTWRNGSFQAHEVVGSNMTWGAHDKHLAPGDTIGWTFDEAGIYGYTCMIHPGMTGVVIVGDVAAAEAPADEASANDLGASSSTEAADDAGADGLAPPTIAAGAGIGGPAVGLALAALLRRRNRSPAG
jgi:plastocyanin